MSRINNSGVTILRFCLRIMAASLHSAVGMLRRADSAPAIRVAKRAGLDGRFPFYCPSRLLFLLLLLQIGNGQGIIPFYRGDKPPCGVFSGLPLTSVWKCRYLRFCGLSVRFDKASGFRLCYSELDEFRD